MTVSLTGVKVDLWISGQQEWSEKAGHTCRRLMNMSFYKLDALHCPCTDDSQALLQLKVIYCAHFIRKAKTSSMLIRAHAASSSAVEELAGITDADSRCDINADAANPLPI